MSINLSPVIFTEAELRAKTGVELRAMFDEAEAQKTELSTQLAEISKKCYIAGMNWNNCMAVNQEVLEDLNSRLAKLTDASPQDRQAIDALMAEVPPRCFPGRDLTKWNANIKAVAKEWAQYADMEDYTPTPLGSKKK